MISLSIEELEQRLEELILNELATDDPRVGYAEIVITKASQPFTVRWVAINEKQIWRTSENYNFLTDAVHAIGLLPGGRQWMASYTPRLVDEREDHS